MPVPTRSKSSNVERQVKTHHEERFGNTTSARHAGSNCAFEIVSRSGNPRDFVSIYEIAQTLSLTPVTSLP